MSTATEHNTNNGAHAQLGYDTGSAHVVITADPNPATPFFAVSKKVHNISLNLHRSRPAGTIKAGARIPVEMERHGDVMGPLFAVPTLPGIAAIDSTTNQALTNGAKTMQPRWCDFVGAAMIEKVEMSITNNFVCSVTNDHIVFAEECLGYAGRSARVMMGKFPSVAEACQRAEKSLTLVVPLPFWFTRALGYYMPSNFLKSFKLHFTSTLKSLKDLIVRPEDTITAYDLAGGTADDVTDVYDRVAYHFVPDSVDYDDIYSGSTLHTEVVPLADTHLVDYYLLAQWAFVVKSERKRIGSGTHQHIGLFGVTQPTDITSTSQSIDIQCEMPTAAAVFFPRTAANLARNQYYDLTAPAPTGQPLCSPYLIKKCVWHVNNNPVQDLDGYMINQLHQYLHCSTMTDLHIGVMSSAVNLANPQPMGWSTNNKMEKKKYSLSMHADCVHVNVLYLFLNLVKFRSGSPSFRWQVPQILS